MKVIIYLQDNGIPAVVVPVQFYVDRYGIHSVAAKDVPAGKPFRIMEASDLPAGPQEEWEIDPATLTDGVGSNGNEFPLPSDEDEGIIEIEAGNQ
ncbi:MAG: hypothetical protein KF895_02925 [Parvibaculum sp.]|nr:hypothetical protein [Parvibaculum sp.]